MFYVTPGATCGSVPCRSKGQSLLSLVLMFCLVPPGGFLLSLVLSRDPMQEAGLGDWVL